MIKKNGRVRVAKIAKVQSDRNHVFAFEAETGLIFRLHKKTFGRVLPDRKYSLPKIHISKHSSLEIDDELIGKTVVFIEGEPSRDGKLQAERWALVGAYAKRAFTIYRVSLVMEGPGGGSDFSPLASTDGVTLWQLAERSGYDIHLAALEVGEGSGLHSETRGLKWEQYKPDVELPDGGTWLECEDPR